MRLFGQRERNQPARVGRHEIDRLGRCALGGDEQIAFVLAVFVVDQDQHAALAHLGQHLLDDEFAGRLSAAHGAQSVRVNRSFARRPAA